MSRVTSLYLASPIHTAEVPIEFMMGVLDTARRLQHMVPLGMFWHLGESMISRARNVIAKVFLSASWGDQQPYSHLLMVDSDMQFTGQDVCNICSLASEERLVIGGVAARKHLFVERIQQALDQGHKLHAALARGTHNVVERLSEPDADGAFVAGRLGAAFLLIHRSVFERMSEALADQYYLPDQRIGTPEYDEAADQRVFAFFDGSIVDGRYLSEDYTFHHRWRQLGGKSYSHAGLQIGHVGRFVYPANPEV